MVGCERMLQKRSAFFLKPKYVCIEYPIKIIGQLKMTKKCGKSMMEESTYLYGVKLAAVSAVCCALGAMEDWLLLAFVCSDVAVLKLDCCLEQARTFDPGQDV